MTESAMRIYLDNCCFNTMMTDTEIKTRGVEVLSPYLGEVEAERFIALIQREPFDDTQWRQQLDQELSIQQIRDRAMALRHQER